MKRLLVFLALAAPLFLMLAASSPVVFAVDVFPGSCTADICKDNSSAADSPNPLFGPSGIITNVTKIVSRFVGIIAVIAALIAGFMMINSAGDSTKTATARRAFTYSLVGLVIAALAQVMVSFVLART